MNNLEPTSIISLRDVSMAYDSRRVLSAVNLDIARGDFVAVTGPNGGGKTTLMHYSETAQTYQWGSDLP